MIDFELLQARLREAVAGERENDWPAKSLAVLAEAGCWGHAVAKAHGGAGVAPIDQLRTYEVVASASLTDALVLTQHDGACELLGDCDNAELAARLLPEFASGRALTTVGISQLTTSRRGSGPAMTAVADGDDYRLTGVMPWVTSAKYADHIVTGGVLDDGLQILACVPTGGHGLVVCEPMELMALTGSYTSEVRCEGLRVPPDQVMRGPTGRVLALRAPVKPLSVSAVGIGVAGAILDSFGDKTKSLPDAAVILDGDIPSAYQSVRNRLYDAADVLHDPQAEIPSMEIRVAVNDLVVRLAVTLMTLAKGSGYLANRPAGRLLREAMFFLVWSAPPAVQTGTLRALWDGYSNSKS
ncbi:MAG: acyl-CoA/acyl-ACP dehydrogenase [Planctomycetes bacterium]|nr:acyl-CoA/acyl-ACP dehydrogenase [Planctomycetota bacterium]